MKFRNLHPWDLSIPAMIALQKKLADRIILKNRFSKIRRIAGADIAIDEQNHEGIAGVLIFSFPELQILEKQQARMKIRIPYIPGLLSFRESPLLLKAFRKVDLEPDLIIIDGQGIAHPRRFGIASHLGLILNKPAIGCAKSLLTGAYREPGMKQGSVSQLLDRGRRIGSAVRTRDNINPVFISPGHRIDFRSSVRIILQCCDGFRIPKPTREADHYVEEAKRNFLRKDLSLKRKVSF